MAKQGHAVVLGASMGGLGAARALTNHFERVTLVERDTLPTGADARKGVPQGRHAHGVLPSGFRLMDSYFPGMMDELVAGGAVRGDLTGDFLWHQYGGWKLRTDTNLGGIVVSRLFLEAKVRERVRTLADVTFLENHDIEEPIFDAKLGRVTAARVRDRESGEEKTLEAELVVDVTGRGSVAPKWLNSWGFGEVEESLVKIDVGYATGAFERREGDLYGSMGAIIAGAPPSKRMAAVLSAEGPRWIVTLVGVLGDHPSSALDEWRDFSHGLPTEDVFELVKDREPLEPIVKFRFPANRHRHYEKLTRFPEGFLILGDAFCSFNPIYGQGMSVAFCEAEAMDECLTVGGTDLAKRFFPRAAEICLSPWMVATGEDFNHSEVEGERPPGHSMISAYMRRAHGAARKDPVVLRRFFEVASLLAPPTAMMAPSIAWRVALGGLGELPAGPPALKVLRPA